VRNSAKKEEMSPSISSVLPLFAIGSGPDYRNQETKVLSLAHSPLGEL